jgi:pyrimidine operon attenuation protein/uracil phosphoribosyltransferase
MSPEDMERHTHAISDAILARHPNTPLSFVGIYTGGAIFAERVYDRVKALRDDITLGSIDISLYRDDLDNLDIIPTIKKTILPFSVEGAQVVLFDDVLYTGRTIRAAIDLLIDYGRPAKIELAVLVDRGNRELPIAPDYEGVLIDVHPEQRIKVQYDTDEGVYLQ